MDRVRFTAVYSGMVQGVGFRYMTQRIADGFDVRGYVRNLPDGGVEVVVEGERGEVQRFLEAVEEAMRGYIRDRQVNEQPATGQWSGFSIRH